MPALRRNDCVECSRTTNQINNNNCSEENAKRVQLTNGEAIKCIRTVINSDYSGLFVSNPPMLLQDMNIEAIQRPDVVIIHSL